MLVQLQLQVGKFADIAIGALEPLLVLACRIARLLQPLLEPRQPPMEVSRQLHKSPVTTFCQHLHTEVPQGEFIRTH